MKKYLFFISFSLLSMNMMGQKISGMIKDDAGKPINNTTVFLIRAKDSIVVKFSASKSDGKYQFDRLDSGSYKVKTSHIGYKNNFSESFKVNAEDINLPDIQMLKASTNLDAVVVTAKKPMVEIKADKTILNVEGTINAVGTDALELLRKSPGVLVDKDDNLSLSGKTGVQVYIDGRPTPLAGKDLADFLKSMQSSNVEAIEIITNPSAKYEAAGNAGIINIRLKKNKSFGTNGSVNAGWAIGTYAKYNTGLSLNNRNKKTNLFGTYNFNKNRNINTMEFYRTVADTLFDQKNEMQSRGNNHNYKAGLDYTISKKSTAGFIVNGSISENELASKSRTPISYIPTGEIVKNLHADNSSDMSRSNINVNTNYRYADTTGRELNMDGDYAHYDMNSNQLQPNIYYDKTGQNEISRVVYNMLAPTNINLYSFKTDYEQNFKKGKLGIGGKISFVNTDNDFKRYNVYSNSKVLDTLRSNRFDYKENINAVYLNYNRSFKGFVIQAGLRAEKTNLTGTSTGKKLVNGSGYVAYDSTFKRDYIDFFPSIAVTFNKNPMNQWGLSYSRRIDRPAYQDLNPFEFKLDEYTFQKGNTNLRPQYTNSIGITNTYKYKLNTRLNYSHVQDIFSQLIDTAEKSKSFISKQNLATQDIVSLNISYPFTYKKFSSFFNINSSYSAFKANFGEGRKVNLDVFSYNLYMQNSLKMGKTWTAELSGFYTSPSIWQGTFESKAMGGMDIGVQKTIIKGKGTIKTTVSDVFHTMRWSGDSNFAGQFMRASGRWESQQFRMNFSYRFGNSQVKAARQRKNAIEEENKRTQGGGGGIGQ
jgi:iron complex outermembrane recepter protein